MCEFEGIDARTARAFRCVLLVLVGSASSLGCRSAIRERDEVDEANGGTGGERTLDGGSAGSGGAGDAKPTMTADAAVDLALGPRPQDATGADVSVTGDDAKAPPSADPDGAKPRRAFELVDSIGVNTHVGFTDTVYYQRFEEVRAKLVALGVKHIRDHNSTNPGVVERLNRLHDEHGIGLLQRIDGRPSSAGPLRFDLIDAEIANLKRNYARSNEVIEGPNEYDLNGGTPDYAALARYTGELYQRVKADPVLRTRPVVLSPMGWTGRYPMLGDVSASIDFGNMHPYPGGKNPASDIDWHIERARAASGDKPLYCTETGYHNAVLTASTHKPTSEDAEARYMPRLYAEYFLRGIARTYDYDLVEFKPDPDGQVDSERHFGLLTNDLREKPAYVATKNLIALLDDAANDFTPTPLRYSLGGDTANVHQLLLQKTDGRWYLLLWQEVRSWDENARRAIAVADKAVTVELARAIDGARAFLPKDGVAPVRTLGGGTSITIAVPDHVLVLEISRTPR